MGLKAAECGKLLGKSLWLKTTKLNFLKISIALFQLTFGTLYFPLLPLRQFHLKGFTVPRQHLLI